VVVDADEDEVRRVHGAVLMVPFPPLRGGGSGTLPAPCPAATYRLNHNSNI
jgi:hypothetical protein